MKESRKLLTIALPAMIEQFLQLLMGFVDNYLVAKIGIIAVSGVAVANNILAIYQALFIAIGAAISSLLSRQLVNEKNTAQNQVMADTIVVTLSVSMLCGLIAIVGNVWLLRRLGVSDSVAQVGGLYLAIVGGGTVGLGLLTSLSAIVRTKGRTKLPMHVSLLTNLLNVILSVMTLFLWHWGIVGVAISTVLSRLVGVLLLARTLPIRAILGHFRWSVNPSLLHLILPAAGERLMMRAGDVVIVSIIVAFGTQAVAGNAVGEALTQFNYLPAMAVSVATVIEVAATMTKSPQKLNRVVRSSFWLALSMMYAVAGAVWLLQVPLITLFVSAPEAMAASKIVVFYALLGVPATAGTLIMTAIWQGLGNARLPFYATTIGMWVIRIGLGYLIGIVWQQGLSGVWMATVLDNIFRWCFLSYLYKKEKIC